MTPLMDLLYGWLKHHGGDCACVLCQRTHALLQQLEKEKA
jgi:hypothetical protein